MKRQVDTNGKKEMSVGEMQDKLDSMKDKYRVGSLSINQRLPVSFGMKVLRSRVEEGQ